MCIPYYQKIEDLFGSSIIAHWPLYEATGPPVAHDICGHQYNGSCYGINWGYPGIGDYKTSPYFPGVSNFIDCYSSALAAAFNGSEGSFMIWPRVHNANVWTDGLLHWVLAVNVDASNYLRMFDAAGNMGLNYRAGNVMKELTFTTTTVDFFSPWRNLEQKQR